ncbi:MAG TPA: HD domain-containing phosphohydrolase [Candidatus Sulfotelmatobacter sp.]|jgi:diguanylate cyclase (GGDEF)-like protein/putative nucleotidyltransferase with HDIG domain|nr:HD domain-containing phosphohydrolase [Candidatus Sulfotelmatobacter sp.]
MRAETEKLSIQTKLFVGITASSGVVVLGFALLHFQSQDPLRFLCYLAVAVLASGLKVQLPGIDGTMSVNFLFILLGVLELSLPETLLIGCTATLVQSVWQSRNGRDPVKILFNVAGMMANASGLTYLTYHSLAQRFGSNKPILLMVAALVFFFANTLPISIVIALTEHKSSRRVWSECYFWSFPYYLVGAAAVGLVGIVNRSAGWETSLLVLPLIYWVYRSYRLYLGRLEAEKERVEIEKRHVEQIASLNMRTIEALALAIEAKDHTTHTHLQRVRTYAVAVATQLNLPEDQIEALRAAALLHDIGKLAVPEQIINKPGKLTTEEFEKMKVHPIVGAEILERVAFPYPVAPIVRSHHERWDGTGYPEGLSGDAIPIGARILAAVDCLDALASHRQYRPALPLAEAMAKVKEMAGKWFDPQVVEILASRYVELERMAQMSVAQMAEDTLVTRGLSKTVRVERGLAPATGFEREPTVGMADSADFLTSIASARQEAQTMFELSQDLGVSLSLSETLSVLSMRLRRMIPYDSIAVFVNRNGWLLPELVSGENFRMLSSLKIKLGEGLCGWVAANCKPIVNGNPQVEAGYVVDPGKHIALQSALVVPLEGLNGVVGVLAMYQANRDAFTPDHLRILLAVASKVALSVENALKYQQAESSATTDYLTGLPNARSLFMHLAQEVARCRRMKTALAVMVCDIDGFKQINDSYGHLEGDKLLREFTARLKDVCRGYDYVARMGGDEFVITAPGLTSEAATEKADRLNQAAIDAGRHICGRDLITLSVGIAFCPEDGFDVERLLAEADRRMYSMKQVHHAAAERDTKTAGAAAN